MHRASYGANTELMRLLVQLGLDENHENSWGWKAVRGFDIWGRLTSEQTVEPLRHLIEALDEISLQDVSFYVSHLFFSENHTPAECSCHHSLPNYA